MMFAAIGSLIGTLFNGVVSYFDNKQKIAAAIAQNKVRLALDQQQYNENWEMEALKDGDKWLKRISFAIFMAPLILTEIHADWGTHIFGTLQNLPDWYLKAVLSINGAVWGIATMKNSVLQIVSAIKKGS